MKNSAPPGSGRESPQQTHTIPSCEGISDQQRSQIGAEVRRGRGQPQRTHEAGSSAETKASTGLRSTLTTARQREVSDSGRSTRMGPELLLKTHLTGSAARCLALQYISVQELSTSSKTNCPVGRAEPACDRASLGRQWRPESECSGWGVFRESSASRTASFALPHAFWIRPFSS